MSQKITCPHCEKEFPMEEGLRSHLKALEDKRVKKIENEQGEKLKKKEKKLKELEDSNKNKDDQLKSFKEQKDHEIKKAVEQAMASKGKDLDKQHKEHYEALYETKLKTQKENLTEQNSEKQKLWELKEKRLISTIEDLQKKATQGTTVDQGSASEMQLGDFLKKIFKDKQDKITEYAKGAAGGDWLQAKELFNKASIANPGDVMARSSNALASYQLNDFAQAEKELRTLIRKYPMFADARAALTALLWREGSLGEAESHWTAAIGLDSRYREEKWLVNVRQWPSDPIHDLMAFLDLEPV